MGEVYQQCPGCLTQCHDARFVPGGGPQLGGEERGAECDVGICLTFVEDPAGDPQADAGRDGPELIVDDHVDDTAVGPDQFVLDVSVLWPPGDVVGLDDVRRELERRRDARAIGVWRSDSRKWESSSSCGPSSISRRAGISTVDYLQSKVR